MHLLHLLVLLLLFPLLPHLTTSTIITSPLITTPTEWTQALSPIILHTDVRITGSSASLTISAGVSVFSNGSTISTTESRGSALRILGTASSPVMFKGNTSLSAPTAAALDLDSSSRLDAPLVVQHARFSSYTTAVRVSRWATEISLESVFITDAHDGVEVVSSGGSLCCPGPTTHIINSTFANLTGTALAVQQHPGQTIVASSSFLGSSIVSINATTALLQVSSCSFAHHPLIAVAALQPAQLHNSRFVNNSVALEWTAFEPQSVSSSNAAPFVSGNTFLNNEIAVLARPSHERPPSRTSHSLSVRFNVFCDNAVDMAVMRSFGGPSGLQYSATHNVFACRPQRDWIAVRSGIRDALSDARRPSLRVLPVLVDPNAPVAPHPTIQGNHTALAPDFDTIEQAFGYVLTPGDVSRPGRISEATLERVRSELTGLPAVPADAPVSDMTDVDVRRALEAGLVPPLLHVAVQVTAPLFISHYLVVLPDQTLSLAGNSSLLFLNNGTRMAGISVYGRLQMRGTLSLQLVPPTAYVDTRWLVIVENYRAPLQGTVILDVEGASIVDLPSSLGVRELFYLNLCFHEAGPQPQVRLSSVSTRNTTTVLYLQACQYGVSLTISDSNFRDTGAYQDATTVAATAAAIASPSAIYYYVTNTTFSGGAVGFFAPYPYASFDRLVEGCTFAGQSVAGLHTSSAGSSHVLRNNTFRDCTGAALDITFTFDMLVAQNQFYNNSIGLRMQILSSFQHLVTDVLVDNRFCDSGWSLVAERGYDDATLSVVIDVRRNWFPYESMRDVRHHAVLDGVHSPLRPLFWVRPSLFDESSQCALVATRRKAARANAPPLHYGVFTLPEVYGDVVVTGNTTLRHPLWVTQDASFSSAATGGGAALMLEFTVYVLGSSTLHLRGSDGVPLNIVTSSQASISAEMQSDARLWVEHVNWTGLAPSTPYISGFRAVSISKSTFWAPMSAVSLNMFSSSKSVLHLDEVRVVGDTGQYAYGSLFSAGFVVATHLTAVLASKSVISAFHVDLGNSSFERCTSDVIVSTGFISAKHSVFGSPRAGVSIELHSTGDPTAPSVICNSFFVGGDVAVFIRSSWPTVMYDNTFLHQGSAAIQSNVGVSRPLKLFLRDNALCNTTADAWTLYFGQAESLVGSTLSGNFFASAQPRRAVRFADEVRLSPLLSSLPTAHVDVHLCAADPVDALESTLPAPGSAPAEPAQDEEEIAWSGRIVLNELFTVPSRAILRIDPGTEVVFADGGELVVSGGLFANNATFDGTRSFSGGVYMMAGQLVCTACTFFGFSQAAVSVHDDAVAVRLTLHHASFQNNSIGVDYAQERDSPYRAMLITNSSFSNNSIGVRTSDRWANQVAESVAPLGDLSNVAVTRTAFVHNDKAVQGSSLRISLCSFRANAVAVSTAVSSIEDSDFEDNQVGVLYEEEDSRRASLPVHLVGNTFVGHSVAAVHVDLRLAAATSQLSSNSFCGNMLDVRTPTFFSAEQVSVNDEKGPAVDMRRNYWGAVATNESLIRSRIQDAAHTLVLSELSGYTQLVLVQPWLTTAPREATLPIGCSLSARWGPLGSPPPFPPTFDAAELNRTLSHSTHILNIRKDMLWTGSEPFDLLNVHVVIPASVVLTIRGATLRVGRAARFSVRGGLVFDHVNVQGPAGAFGNEDGFIQVIAVGAHVFIHHCTFRDFGDSFEALIFDELDYDAGDFVVPTVATSELPQATISMSNTTFSNMSSVFDIEGSAVTVTNCTFRHCGLVFRGDASKGGAQRDRRPAVFDRCTFEDNQIALRGELWLAQHCVFRRHSLHAVLVYNWYGAVSTLADCVFVDNYVAVKFDDTCDHARFTCERFEMSTVVRTAFCGNKWDIVSIMPACLLLATPLNFSDSLYFVAAPRVLDSLPEVPPEGLQGNTGISFCRLRSEYDVGLPVLLEPTLAEAPAWVSTMCPGAPDTSWTDDTMESNEAVPVVLNINTRWSQSRSTAQHGMIVPFGVTLTIDTGAEIEFAGPLVVHGRLECHGSAARPVRLTAGRLLAEPMIVVLAGGSMLLNHTFTNTASSAVAYSSNATRLHLEHSSFARVPVLPAPNRGSSFWTHTSHHSTISVLEAVDLEDIIEAFPRPNVTPPHVNIHSCVFDGSAAATQLTTPSASAVHITLTATASITACAFQRHSGPAVVLDVPSRSSVTFEDNVFVANEVDFLFQVYGGAAGGSTSVLLENPARMSPIRIHHNRFSTLLTVTSREQEAVLDPIWRSILLSQNVICGAPGAFVLSSATLPSMDHNYWISAGRDVQHPCRHAGEMLFVSVPYRPVPRVSQRLFVLSKPPPLSTEHVALWPEQCQGAFSDSLSPDKEVLLTDIAGGSVALTCSISQGNVHLTELESSLPLRPPFSPTQSRYSVRLGPNSSTTTLILTPFQQVSDGQEQAFVRVGSTGDSHPMGAPLSFDLPIGVLNVELQVESPLGDTGTYTVVAARDPGPQQSRGLELTLLLGVTLPSDEETVARFRSRLRDEMASAFGVDRTQVFINQLFPSNGTVSSTITPLSTDDAEFVSRLVEDVNSQLGDPDSSLRQGTILSNLDTTQAPRVEVVDFEPCVDGVWRPPGECDLAQCSSTFCSDRGACIWNATAAASFCRCSPGFAGEVCDVELWQVYDETLSTGLPPLVPGASLSVNVSANGASQLGMCLGPLHDACRFVCPAVSVSHALPPLTPGLDVFGTALPTNVEVRCEAVPAGYGRGLVVTVLFTGTADPNVNEPSVDTPRSTSTQLQFAMPTIVPSSLRRSASESGRGESNVVIGSVLGDVVRFNGTGFVNISRSSAVPADVSVTVEKLGGVVGVCDVLWMSATTLECELSSGSTANNSLVLHMGGFAVESPDKFSYPTVPVIERVTGCAPSDISPNATQHCPTTGGVVLTVAGRYLRRPLSITIGGAECLFQTATAQGVLCLLPAGVGLNVPVLAFHNGFLSLPAPFVSYAAPSIIAVEPGPTSKCSPGDSQRLSVVGCDRRGDWVRLIGLNFGTEASATVGGVPCVQVDRDAASAHQVLLCRSAGGTQEHLAVVVSQKYGESTVSSPVSADVTVSFEQCLPGYEESASACVACAPGTASPSPSSPCENCTFGTAAAQRGSPRCGLCPPGRHTSRERSIECDECSAGSFASQSGQIFCAACPPGRFNVLEGLTHCFRCPKSGIVCEPDRLLAMAGFWLDGSALDGSSDAANMVEEWLYTCPRSVCVSGGKCASGRKPARQNVLCGTCAAGRAEWGGRCVSCEGSIQGGLVAAFVLAGLVPVYALHKMSQRSTGKSKVLFLSVQISVFLVGRMSKAASWLHLANFDANSAIPLCLFPLSPVDQYVLALSTPLLFFAELLVLMVGSRLVASLRGGKVALEWDWRPYFRTLLALCLFTYTAITTATLRFLNCVDVTLGGEPREVVFQWPAIDCGSDAYRAYLPLAIAALVFVVVAVPMGVAAVLVFNRHRLHHPKFQLLFGVLYEPYRTQTYYWQFIGTARRTVYAVLELALFNNPPSMFLAFAYWTLFLLVVHLVVKPYHLRSDNALETGALSCMTVIALLLVGVDHPLSARNRTLASSFALIPVILLTLLLAARLLFERVPCVQRTAKACCASCVGEVAGEEVVASEAKSVPTSSSRVELEMSPVQQPSARARSKSLSALSLITLDEEDDKGTERVCGAPE